MAKSNILEMTATEFNKLPESNQIQELINGVVIVSPSPVDVHQDTVLNVAVFVRTQMPGGKVVIAPMDVYFDDLNVLQPDVFWLADDSQCVNRDGYYYGAPELVIEVHSPATITRDKREKFAIYQQHGVLEYWMIDPTGKHMEIWQRHDSRYSRLGVFSSGDTFHSLALGVELTLSGIFPM